MKAEIINIGLGVKQPGKSCNENRCPFHGTLKVRGRQFTGAVISTKMRKTAVVEWEWMNYIKKYERYEKKRTALKAHNPSCIDAKDGDIVRIAECRPLSKSKSFVIVERLGAAKGFQEMMRARMEAKKERLEKEEIKEKEAKEQEPK